MVERKDDGKEERKKGKEERREGRGRLNSIELLPDEAEPDIVWVMQELRERSKPQVKILAEFNARLADRGLGPISAGAFSRHSVRLARYLRRMERVREAAATMAHRFDPKDADELTNHATEMIKMLVAEIGEDAEEGDLSPKALKEMAEAVRAAEAAQNIGAERRRKLELELAARMKAAEKATEAAAEGIAAASPGVDKAAVLKRIRQEVYGIFDR